MFYSWYIISREIQCNYIVYKRVWCLLHQIFLHYDEITRKAQLPDGIFCQPTGIIQLAETDKYAEIVMLII